MLRPISNFEKLFKFYNPYHESQFYDPYPESYEQKHKFEEQPKKTVREKPKQAAVYEKPKPATVHEKPKVAKEEFSTKNKTELDFQEVIDTALKVRDLVKRAALLLDYIQSICKNHAFDVAEKVITHIPFYKQDQGYYIIAENQLLFNEMQNAIQTALKINESSMKDEFLFKKIYMQNLSNISIKTCKLIAKNITDNTWQCGIYLAIGDEYLSKNKIDKAIKIADAMPKSLLRDDLQIKIIEIVLEKENPDFKLIENLADKCSYCIENVYQTLIKKPQVKNNREVLSSMEKKILELEKSRYWSL